MKIKKEFGVHAKGSRSTYAFLPVCILLLTSFVTNTFVVNESLCLLGLQSTSVVVEPATLFVLYASIFGNYRNEQKGLAAALEPFSEFNFTRFLFTDSDTIDNITGWNIVRADLGEGFNGIPASRVRIKELKFRGHEVLQKHRYWIHVDTKRGALKTLHKLLENGLMSYVQCHPSKALFVRKHPARKTVEQEVNTLKKMPHLQPLSPLMLWDTHLKQDRARHAEDNSSQGYHKWNRVQLTENNIFVLDSHHRDFLTQWASIHDTLLEWGLWRDQVVYSYSLIDCQDRVEYIDPKSKLTCPEPATMTSLNATLSSRSPPGLRLHPSKKCLSDGTAECGCEADGLTIGVLYNNEDVYLSAILNDWSTWSNESKQGTEFIVVDDGSDQNRSASVVIRRASARAVLPSLRVLTILDNLEWNIGGARNLLMHSAKHCSVVLLDNDYILPESLVTELRATAPKNIIYRLKRNHTGKADVHPGIMYTTSSTYFEIGGADEDFVGNYGQTDPHIVWRAGKHGVPVKPFDSNARLQPQSSSLSRPGRSRDASVNKRLYVLKQEGEIPWSTTYLRFRWTDSIM